MTYRCDVTGKVPLSGNKVSHSNRKTKRRFFPNLQNRRIWCEETGRFVRVRVSRKGLRIIDKVGVKTALSGKSKLRKPKRISKKD